MKKNAAFTLVELIVIICIMAIFIGVSVPSMFSWVNSSKKKADSNSCIVLQQIVTDAVKNNNFEISSTDTKIGFITWTANNKEILRNLIKRELGTARVPVPRQNEYAFFVYLLPPYTVTCFPVSNTSNIDGNDALLNKLTDDYLLKYYPKSKYPQMYSSTYTENGNTGSISKPSLQIPTFLSTNDATFNISLVSTYIGCINIPDDFT